MSPDPRPTMVRCCLCGEDVAARDAREALLLWARTASGDGGTTGAAGHLRSNLWCCPVCFRGRIDPRGPQPPERKLHAGDLASLALRDLKSLIPQDPPLESGEGRARFRDAMEAIDAKRKEPAT